MIKPRLTPLISAILVLSGFAGGSAHAVEDSSGSPSAQPSKPAWWQSFIPSLPAAKLTEVAKKRHLYAGVGMTQELLHGTAEWLNPYGIAYAKAGVFYAGDRPVGGQVGFRYPYHLTGQDGDGYYIGTYAGLIDLVSLDGEDQTRLGAGIDLAYVLVDRERISTLSVGIGAAQGKQGVKGSKVATEPLIQFAYNLSFGLR